MSETVTISSQNGNVQFSFENEAATGSINIDLKDSIIGKIEQSSQEMAVAVKQQYAIRYLNMFNKAAPLSMYARLSLDPDKPLVVKY